jgi:3-methyladenine DNA glycosylase/8-oxoguanine DNA glycosylase
MQERVIRLGRPVSLSQTLGMLQRGRRDPTMQLGLSGVWRASRSPGGPVTTHLSSLDPHSVRVRAWGPGSEWALDAAPRLLGATDDSEGEFVAHHPVVAELIRRHPHLRIPRTEAAFEALVPAILEQKVVGLEAKRSYALMVRRHGEPAPGPAGLWLPPAAAALADLPTYAFHSLGLERKRGDTVRLAATHAARFDEAVHLGPRELARRLMALPGIGPWTAAEVTLRALGDPDAVSVGDYHTPSLVAWALAGEPRGDDARMLELLEPYAGHRGRVIRLLEVGHPAAPRYGPRLSVRSIAGL